MKKGKVIKNISKSDDFYEMFDVKPKNLNEKESFEELLKASENDPIMKKLQAGKIKSFNKKIIFVKERIKSYPQPQRKLDLHGLTSLEAEAETERFISVAMSDGLKTVRVITGKGYHSLSGPVLRDKIEILANLLKKNGKILSWKWEKKYKEKSGSIVFFLY